jgi:F-type H+-transporting ATPase subunit b
MISLDYSLIPAILIFLTLIFALNYLLFKPIQRVQAERESRTTGLIAQSRRELENQQKLFEEYEEKIRRARTEGYQIQEQWRADAMKKRSGALDEARGSAEQIIEQSRASISAEVQAAKTQLAGEAREIARGITATILQRSA